MKSFYKYVFKHQHSVRPTHVSLYMFLLNQNNRCDWEEWFKLPHDTGMRGSCIGTPKTYYRVLKELKEFGVIDYTPGINANKSPMIKIMPNIKVNDDENE